MQKAREGIRVRVLYDWMGSLMTARSFWRELQRAGVKVRVVNPRRCPLPCEPSSGITGSFWPWTAGTSPRAG
jgi:phosphatidylserine/phosphatidylglycerophosphate/cardiolipin synthase-like enzyme